MKIAIGTDHAGFAYKESIKGYLRQSGHEVEDYGVHSEESADYPLYIRPVAEAVARGESERGIVLGGSGNGEAITANRVKGVRCTLCWSIESASLARGHNDSNVLSLGARLVPLDLALEIVQVWLDTPFDGGRHLRRIQMIDNPEMGKTGGRVASTDATAGSGPAHTEKYDVTISFGYILYMEGKNTLEIKVEPGLKKPSVVRVPSASRWDEEMPEWARGRREEIMERIKPKCVHLKCEWKEI